jgi:nucleotide-binding universal stress UspA family protein
MGTSGWRGVDKALLGSTAERVIRDAPCPVLVVKQS